MAHTSEQRDRHALCGARKKNGDLCRKFAGEGTDHFGAGRCKYHLGNSKNHRVNAVKQEAVKRSVDVRTEDRRTADRGTAQRPAPLRWPPRLGTGGARRHGRPRELRGSGAYAALERRARSRRTDRQDRSRRRGTGAPGGAGRAVRDRTGRAPTPHLPRPRARPQRGSAGAPTGRRPAAHGGRPPAARADRPSGGHAGPLHGAYNDADDRPEGDSCLGRVEMYRGFYDVPLLFVRIS